MIIEYQLAENFVVRKKDWALFDSKNLQIIKFNPLGFELIEFLQNGEISIEKYIEYATTMGISEEDFHFFLNKCINQGIIKEIVSPSD